MKSMEFLRPTGRPPVSEQKFKATLSGDAEKPSAGDSEGHGGGHEADIGRRHEPVHLASSEKASTESQNF